MSLDVTQAYYDAVLADQLVTIADSSLAQTEAVLAQTTRCRGRSATPRSIDLLRAQVTRDNQLPVLHPGAWPTRQVAYLRLKQLLNMPLDDPLQLTTRIEEPAGPALPSVVANAPTDTLTSDRAPVRELDESVRAQEAQVKIARAERIPSLVARIELSAAVLSRADLSESRQRREQLDGGSVDDLSDCSTAVASRATS